MLRHTLLLIYRNFRRFKTTFFINLIGLSTGLACTLLIYLWVRDEFSFDAYHEKDDMLYQVMEHVRNEKGMETRGHTQGFLAEVLAAEMPEIEHAITATPPSFFAAFTVTGEDTHVKGVGKYVGEDFFRMFSYDLIQGNSDLVLSDKNSMAISERTARRLFPDMTDVIGKTVQYEMQTLKKQVTITGVFEDVPRNSSERFDFIFPFEAFNEIMGFDNRTLAWDRVAPFYTYVTLKEGTNAVEFNDKLGSFLKNKSPDAAHRTLFIKRFSDNYLYGRYENGVQSGGRIEYVNLFSTIAAFILIIACINFMNLSTAKVSRRIKEIGIKKAIGARRYTLGLQYMGESMLMSLLSLLLAVLLVDLFLPLFNLVTGKDLSLNINAEMIIASLCITLITGILAGSYPAFYLSGLNTTKVLKGQLDTSVGERWARKGLVVFQFSISVIFIVAVLVVYRQIEFVQTKNLGYDNDNVLYFETDGKVAYNAETFLSEVKQIPGVVNASSMLGTLIGGNGKNPGGGTKGTHVWNGRVVPMTVFQVNYDMIETLGIEIIAGRSFSRDHGSDSMQIIYNEAAIDALGITDPVGRVLPDGTEIVGVAKNFHHHTLHLKIQPQCLMLEPDYPMTVMIKIKSGMEKGTIEALQRFHNSFNPGFEFNYNFMDESYQAQYAGEKRVASLSKYFAGLAVLISCLGLFGLASFTAERRRKEIGIRKVLGSSAEGIVFLLSKDFTKIVLLSVIIGLPISYFVTVHWLASFAYRISLEWWYFIGAGLLALLIAWLTVGTQAIKAARVNPVKCLREE